MIKEGTPSASVVMAAYNGERYIARQVESILSQLRENDELVISVDPSTDATKQIALRFASADNRVRVLEGPGRGVVRNFENALAHVRGGIIFLSDQDDVWHPAKLRSCIAALQDGCASAVVHDAVVVDGDLNELQSSVFKGGFYSGVWRNVLRNRYMGCCMAFRREVLDAALPFPPKIPMHDQWLGIAARRLGEVAYIDKPLVFYRRHNNTVTGREKAGPITRLRWRLDIVMALVRLKKRTGRTKKADGN